MVFADVVDHGVYALFINVGHMVYFFSISHLALEDFQEVTSALRKSQCPGAPYCSCLVLGERWSVARSLHLWRTLHGRPLCGI